MQTKIDLRKGRIISAHISRRSFPNYTRQALSDIQDHTTSSPTTVLSYQIKARNTYFPVIESSILDSFIAKMAKGNLKKRLTSSKCFNRLLTFKPAIFKPFNLVTQCNMESLSPLVGSSHAILMSNGEVSCVVICSLFVLLVGLRVVLPGVLGLQNPFVALIVFPVA